MRDDRRILKKIPAEIYISAGIFFYTDKRCSRNVRYGAAEIYSAFRTEMAFAGHIS